MTETDAVSVFRRAGTPWAWKNVKSDAFLRQGVFSHFQNLFLIFGLLMLAGRFVSSAAIFLLARLLIM